MAVSTLGYVAANFTIPASTTISVTNGGGGPTTVTITAGTYNIDTFMTQLQSDLQTQRAPSGSAWTCAVSLGSTGTGKVTIDAPTDTWSITWTSTAVRDVLGFTANITSVTTAQTGAAQARGLWMPNCPLFPASGKVLSAPRVTDLRQTVSPTGFVISHVGNSKYMHNGLRWSHVEVGRVWQASEAVTNESLEKFLTDAQFGLGSPLFTPGSKCKIYSHEAETLGDTTIAGWYIQGAGSMESVVKRVDASWDGLWSVEFSVTTDA